MQNEQFFIWFPINLIKYQFYLYFLYELLISLRIFFLKAFSKKWPWCFLVYNFVWNIVYKLTILIIIDTMQKNKGKI